MLNRLHQLRDASSRLAPLVERETGAETATKEAASGPNKEVDNDAEEDAAQKAKAALPPKESEAELEEYLEFLDQMQELYREILGFEGAAAQSIDELRHHVDNMEETVRQEREALLPATILQLSNRFESQELVCQRVMHGAKSNIDTLKHREAELIIEQVKEQSTCARWLWPDKERLAHSVPELLEPVRQSMASARAAEYKRLVLRFFDARSENKAELIMRTTRQLRFAFPDAMECEIEQVMEFPEHGIMAVARRLEKGQVVTLEQFIIEKEADREKANQNRLVVGAKEVKLMMLQFSELIDNQGEDLTAIEDNIKSVLEQTNEAVVVLTDALKQKREWERNMRRFKIAVACILLLVFMFLLYSHWKGIKRVIFPDAHKRADKGGHKHASHLQLSFDQVQGAPRKRIKSRAAQNHRLPGVMQSIALTSRGNAARQHFLATGG